MKLGSESAKHSRDGMLMREVPHAGQDHRQMMLIGGGDDFAITD